MPNSSAIRISGRPLDCNNAMASRLNSSVKLRRGFVIKHPSCPSRSVAKVSISSEEVQIRPSCSSAGTRRQGDARRADTRRGSPTVRWVEINGNSASGKSSLMQAGLLPLIDEGWLWPRTEIAHWRRIGPMIPGEHPVEMLAEHLARTFGAKMGEVYEDLQDGDSALRY